MKSRDALVEEIVADFADTARWTGRSAPSARLLAALKRVPREAFVPPSEAPFAYINAPLPIGHRQTISQPFIVAIMTELLDAAPDSVVLEIGTGSGYQAAILAEIGARVYSVEIIPELAENAKKALAATGYANVQLRVGDGRAGWPEHAPYDGIIVTAAAAEVPPALVAQLKPGGRLVIPVGSPGGEQILSVIEKTGSGETRRRDTLPVAFVPLVRGAPPA